MKTAFSALVTFLILTIATDAIAQTRKPIARKRFPSQASQSSEPEEPVAIPRPVAQPVAEPVAQPVAEPVATPIAEVGTKTESKPESTSSIPSLSDVTSKLPEDMQSILSDGRVQTVIEAAESNQDEILNQMQETYRNASEQGKIPTSLPTAPAEEPATSIPPMPEPEPQQTSSTPPEPDPAPILNSDPGIVAAPEPLKPKYQRTEADAPNPGKKDAEQTGEVMKIRANETDMRKDDALFIFRGDVFVIEPNFTLYSDELWVYQYKEGETPAVNEKGEEQTIKRAIATGKIVEIKRINKDGEAEVAQARRADYDTKTGEVTLSGGPPVLQSGGRLVQTSSSNAKIILTADGNQRIEDGNAGGSSSQGTTILIPMKKSEASSPNLPTGDLESIQNKR